MSRPPARLRTQARFAGRTIVACLLAAVFPLTGPAGLAAKEPVVTTAPAENVYRGELVSFPGVYGLNLLRPSIILVSDAEMKALADPDTPINISLRHEPDAKSLRQICQQAKERGQHTLAIAFDEFFTQYRGKRGVPRTLYPDSPEYIRRIAAIGQFAAGFGLGLELSLLSPLEIGPRFAEQTGQSGLWMHYRKGLRDPKTGQFSVELWRHVRWVNNKGAIRLADAGVRVFAFREQPIGDSGYRAVDPADIHEITDVAQVECLAQTRPDMPFPAERIRVFGRGHDDLAGCDRVLVVQRYRTPEMDYFSEQALPFLTGLVDAYADAGVRLNGLYADEMHIQQDWAYHGHHEHGQFAMRYVSDGLAREFARRYGAEYSDFTKYLVYFVTGQEDAAINLSATREVTHAFGTSPEAIRRTALFRARYYQLLQDGVVDLFTAAKRHAEKRMGQRLTAHAHATWAQSPTCDAWRGEGQAQHYEYTPNFLWSNTVHQAAAACHDYFKWGDFLTGNGNDHAEGGWLDRNYYGLALGCSTGIVNDVPHSYAAHWGMPAPIAQRRASLCAVYGTARPPWGAVNDLQHRDVDVLMLYPLNLVAVNERFGSWMNQYGYANQITPAKLVEMGRVVDGAVELAGRRFTTLVATFEPFPSTRLLAMMRDLSARGGRVIWSGPPPVLTAEGGDALAPWCDLFGVSYVPGTRIGQPAPGRQVTFEGVLAGIPPQTILTDFQVDHIYPVATTAPDAAVAARVRGLVVGTHRPRPGGGTATFLGYRPRDDQSASLGYDIRNWFDVLSKLGAYPATGRFPGFNDNTEHLSRTGDVLACRFPNGTVGLAPHLKLLEEGWPGGFARDKDADEAYLKRCPPPSDRIELAGVKVAGHEVTYSGTGAVLFRVVKGQLVAFGGSNCDSITVDGTTTTFAENKLSLIVWAPVPQERRVKDGAVCSLWAIGKGTVRVPGAGLPAKVRMFAEGPAPGSRGAEVPCRIDDGRLVFDMAGPILNRWLYVVAAD